MSTGGEREVLEAFLDLYRDVLKRKLGGLSDEQIRQRHVPSQTTLGGLIKHLTAVEREWFQVILGGRTQEELGDAPLGDGWTLSTGESAGDLIARYERACAASRREASGLALEDSVPHPRMGLVSLRWIYVHMIEESARHVGHADILREQTDGATGLDGLRLTREPRRHGMVVATYSLFRAECRFSLGSRVPRLGCVGPVVPGGLGVLVVCCPARRVRDYPGGSGPPGGSGTPWGPRITRQAISTPLFAGPGAGGAPGPEGEGQEPAGQGFPGFGFGVGGRGSGVAGVAAASPAAGGQRHQATMGLMGDLWFQTDRTYPGFLTGALAPATGACAPQ